MESASRSSNQVCSRTLPLDGQRPRRGEVQGNPNRECIVQPLGISVAAILDVDPHRAISFCSRSSVPAMRAGKRTSCASILDGYLILDGKRTSCASMCLMMKKLRGFP